MNSHPPTTVSVNAEDDEGKKLGWSLVREAKAMLIGLQGRQADGVSIVGQTRTLPNGVTIKVGRSGNGVSDMGWVQINVPSERRPAPPPRERLDERSDYIWIGLKLVEGAMPVYQCDYHDGYPIGRLMLWVWEPPDGTEPPTIIGPWQSMGLNYTSPVIPPLELPSILGDGNLMVAPSGAYMIHRDYYYPGIVSPVTEPEDGDDLWDTVFVADPGDGQTVNAGALYNREPFDPEMLAQHAVLAGLPTYLLPDHPDYVETENTPIERDRAYPAKIIWAPDPGWKPPPPDPNLDAGDAAPPEEAAVPPPMPYLAKVFYESNLCGDELGPATGRIKIISGKRPYTVIDRYDFTIERYNDKWRAMLPRGSTATQYAPMGTTIPPGDNVMDFGWSEETWEVRPMFGSRIADPPRIPYGLNEGQLPEQACIRPTMWLTIQGCPMTRTYVHSGDGLVDVFATDWHITLPQTPLLGLSGALSALVVSHPRDACGDSVFGPPEVAMTANWLSAATAYQIEWSAVPRLYSNWIPGIAPGQPDASGGLPVYAGSLTFAERTPGGASTPSHDYGVYLAYLPLTNEWMELDPFYDLDALKAIARTRGYGRIGTFNDFAPSMTYVDLYEE